jgi:hypothetical protein
MTTPKQSIEDKIEVILMTSSISFGSSDYGREITAKERLADLLRAKIKEVGEEIKMNVKYSDYMTQVNLPKEAKPPLVAEMVVDYEIDQVINRFIGESKGESEKES